jgi:TRAP transporter TAXI family solute receptor
MRRFLLASMLVLIVVHAAPAGAQSLGVAAGQQGSQNFGANSAIAKILSEEAKFNTRLQSYGGSGLFMPLIDEGSMDLAAITSPELSDAVLGQDAFKGRALKNLRIAAVLPALYSGLFVRKDSPHQTVADIKGLRVPSEYSAQPAIQRFLQANLANAGLTLEDVKLVPVPSIVRGADAFVAGNVDVGHFALAGGKVIEVDSTVGGIRFLKLNTDPEAAAKMQKLVPGSYVAVVKPRPGQVGIPEPTGVFAFDYYLVVGKHLPDDVVDRVVRAVATNAKKLGAHHALFRNFDTNIMVKPLPEGIEWHPGVTKYYTETGQWPPKT